MSMASAAIETVYEFQGLEGWTEEFMPAVRRTRGEPLVVIAYNEREVNEAILDQQDEDMWDAAFARSPEVLELLAAEAEQEDRAGLTEELDPDAL